MSNMESRMVSYNKVDLKKLALYRNGFNIVK